MLPDGRSTLQTTNPRETLSSVGKVHPRTGREGPDGEEKYSSTVSLTSALDGGLVVHATPRPLCSSAGLEG